MLITILVTIRSKEEKIEKQPDGSYKVWVRAVPEKGKANERVIELLADFFNVAKNSVNIISGKTSRSKRVEVKNS